MIFGHAFRFHTHGDFYFIIYGYNDMATKTPDNYATEPKCITNAKSTAAPKKYNKTYVWFEMDFEKFSRNKGEGLVNFFCHDRHPQTDFSGCIWRNKNDGQIKNIGSISFFALELDFVNPARVLAKSRSEFFFHF